MHIIQRPNNNKTLCTMLDQRRRRWADIVQLLYKCFVFDGVETQLVIKAIFSRKIFGLNNTPEDIMS